MYLWLFLDVKISTPNDSLPLNLANWDSWTSASWFVLLLNLWKENILTNKRTWLQQTRKSATHESFSYLIEFKDIWTITVLCPSSTIIQYVFTVMVHWLSLQAAFFTAASSAFLRACAETGERLRRTPCCFGHMAITSHMVIVIVICENHVYYIYTLYGGTLLFTELLIRSICMAMVVS